MTRQTKPNLLDTSKRILHVFACGGVPAHVHPGLVLIMAVNGYVCPTCGGPVADITDTPLGEAYFAFARPDLGARL